MSYDESTHTIRLNRGLDNADFASSSGEAFLRELRDDAAGLPAHHQLARDWITVQRWLGCEGRVLTARDYEAFGLAFRSYLAGGNGPADSLHPAFAKFANMAQLEAWRTVPVPNELIPVFQRLMTPDAELQTKRVSPQNHRVALPPAISTNVLLNWIPIVASIVMLGIASFGDPPRGFFQFLRLVVCATAIYVTVQTINRHKYWPWIMAGVALMFNPVFPVEFSRADWEVIDFVVALVFGAVLLHLRRNPSLRQ